MKRITMSVVAVATLMGSFSAVSAAEKSGVSFKTTGQTVIYYNTAATNKSGSDLFNHAANSKANFGIQLNFDADLGNSFTFGSQVNYLGTLGLEKNLVGGTMQNVNSTKDGIQENNIADDIYLSKLYIAKQLGNTTLKLGRQEVPKSLSPFAFSEGWNVFKNTFDAMLAVNTDIPDTTLVGAYVAKSNHNGFGNDMSTFTDLSVNATGLGAVPITKEAYMLTVANKSLPMTTLTASFYDVLGIANQNSNYVEWLDAKIADKSFPMGLSVGLQGGAIQPDSDLNLDDTSAFGAKIGAKPMKALSLTVAYSHVNDGTVHVQNVGGVKTPLYTQMIANQGAIASDNDTFMLKGVYNTGAYGKVILQGTQSTDNSSASRDLTDVEAIYKVKVVGVNLLAAFINQNWSKKVGGVDSQNIARVVARYNF